jgi:hypothetical protein
MPLWTMGKTVTTDTQIDKGLQTDVAAATDIIDAVDIVGRLPAIDWPLELLYLGIRLHEEAISERQASMAGYDPILPLRIVAEARSLFERLMARAGLAGRNRELVQAYWERGLQSDIFSAVEVSLAGKIAAAVEGRENLLMIVRHYLPDPNYKTESGLAFYGAAAFCLRLARAAGMDHEQLLKEAFDQLLNQSG